VSIVKFKTSGQLRLLIIDLTENDLRWEYDASNRIAASIKKAGVDLVVDRPLQLHDIEAYSDALKKYSDFTALLVFAHGEPDQGSIDASKVYGPGSIREWYSWAEHSENLKDKFLALCVCWGHCQDAISAFVNNGPLALTLLAPTDGLGKDEAEAFFPHFFGELKDYSIESIDPNDVRTVKKKLNCLAGGKMKVYSQGLSAK